MRVRDAHLLRDLTERPACEEPQVQDSPLALAECLGALGEEQAIVGCVERVRRLRLVHRLQGQRPPRFAQLLRGGGVGG